MNKLHSFLLCLLSGSILLTIPGCLDWSKDVDQYREVLNSAQPSTRPDYEPDGPLPLTHALALANADNESIASSGENYIQALAEKMRQAGTFLPSLSLAPSYGFSGGNSTSSLAQQTAVPLQASATGSASQLSSQKAAGLTADQLRQALLDERETILLQVVQSYYTVLKAERQCAVYESSLKSKIERVRDQEARLKLGNIRPLDLAQTQADLAGVRASLTQSRTDAANARSALAFLIGAPAVKGMLDDGYRPPAHVGSLEEWQSRAADHRQDMAAALLNTESTRASLEAAIRQYFPSVTINFNYFLYYDPSSTSNWTGAISANLPIFSALSIEADIRKAWSVYRQAGLAEKQLRRQIVDDVNESFQTLKGKKSRITDLTIQVEAAQRAFDLAERSYQLGSVSNLDRLIQQDNLLTAQLELANEQFNEKISYLTLLRSTGNLASLLQNI
jgi:outer membrane protein TolC